MSLEEKVGDLKLDEKKPEDATEEVKESVLEELTESPPKLHHVETKDTTDPTPGEATTEDGVVKAEVPEAFEEELKKDHDIVPESTGSKEGATEVVKTKAEEVGAETGGKEPATRQVPAEVTHEVVDTKPAKSSSIGEKISSTFQKIVGKDKN